MREIAWYFPEKLEQVPELLKIEGVRPHGGGTFLLRGGMTKVKGLIELSHLPLQYVRRENDLIEVGAACTYADVYDYLQKIDPDHILVKALDASATTPLRNRITVGGSVATFPLWSDLMGPLLALEAEVSVLGDLPAGKQDRYPVRRYVKDRELRKQRLITGIRFAPYRAEDGWSSYYHRETRTHFDYPAFSISILLKKAESKIEYLRIVFVGTLKRYTRLNELEESLKGRAAGEVKIEGLGGADELEFPGRKGFSASYIKHLAGVQLERGLGAVLKS